MIMMPFLKTFKSRMAATARRSYIVNRKSSNVLPAPVFEAGA